MARKKLMQFESLRTLPNTYDLGYIKAAPEKPIFADLLPAHHGNVLLEVGCGTAELALAYAAADPASVVLALDIQGERLHSGATQAQRAGRTNIFFIRAYAHQLPYIVPPHTVDELWVTFPDPRLKKKEIKKRLTAPAYLEIYKTLLNKTGVLCIKTDNETLFEYSLDTVVGANCTILRAGQLTEDAPENVPTKYERIYRRQGKKIFQLQARFE